MKYILVILGMLIGGLLVLGANAVFAADRGNNIPIRVLTIQGTGGGWDNIEFYKFIDPDNGNVCYATQDLRGGISCLKP